MTKTITGYVTDLPENCLVNNNIYTDTGALLCPSMTIIDAKMMESLKRYKGIITAVITYTKETSTTEEVEPDNSVELDKNLKVYISDTIYRIFMNVDNINYVVDNTKELSYKISNCINKTKNDLGINLENLKISDNYTYKHSLDVGTMGGILASELGFHSSKVDEIILAGILHDIGKTQVPIEILNKPGKLTLKEFNIMKGHTLYGYQLLSNTTNISEEIRQGILNHHENMDGSGYPRGLVGDQIGDIGKILSIVDVYDALISDRPYMKAKTSAQALEIMYAMTNKFDLDYFKTFLSLINAYPNGSDLKLSNDENAIVLKQNKYYPLRPIVKILETEEVVDLASDYRYLPVVITN